MSSSTLASYVSGVSVGYDGAPGGGGASVDNSLSNNGAAFQNFAGIQALNQNTGVGASQNAAVTLSVSTGDVNF
ncbi:hypothetical protein GGR43_004695 [Sphingobium jiangsuense]|uniref:Uncharacterized protein n=1 Tax=Sphingobium jiangsuense TaxID=870476 RepID=A0A7W6BW25_9SPHN|nr:hypothetical protein [Sphingobium jiangsuense]MBB3928944.1 hypothetical protein [Sphingobium jiangsuense]